MSLQHQALYTYTKTAKYTGDNTMIEDLIFEIDQIRNNLEDELTLVQGEIISRNKTELFGEIEGYADTAREIEFVLFDDFTYENHITTEAQVAWKEYFHVLYEYAVIDPSEPEMLEATLPYYNTLERPPPLETDDPCYPLVSSLIDDFEELRQIHHDGIITMKTRYDTMKANGLKKLELVKKERDIRARLEIYNSIIEWSMHWCDTFQLSRFRGTTRATQTTKACWKLPSTKSFPWETLEVYLF